MVLLSALLTLWARLPGQQKCFASILSENYSAEKDANR